jgi:hypothetical protein
MTIHPDVRGELGRQRQAELLAQAERHRVAQQALRDQPSVLRRLTAMIGPRVRRPRNLRVTDPLPEVAPLLETD